MSVTLDHSTLGANLKGIEIGNLWQFRGIQYGSIPARFALAKMAALDGEVDCSEYGY
jgi:hypothetical protein